MRRVAFFALVLAATFATLGFLVLPVVAIFTHVSPVTLARQLSNPVVDDALVVSVKTTLEAQALVLAFGTPAAYLLATRRFRGRSLAVTAVELPLVLPPAVAGIGLLVAFSRTGLLHTGLPFTQAAVTLAVAFVSAVTASASRTTGLPRRSGTSPIGTSAKRAISGVARNAAATSRATPSSAVPAIRVAIARTVRR